VWFEGFFLDAKLCDDDDDAHDTLTQKARLGSKSKNYSSLGGGKRLSPQGGGGWPLNSRKMKQQKYPWQPKRDGNIISGLGSL
jgi:hypothetical protein